MEKNCIFSWGLERWGKRESTYALSFCTEGVKIYLFFQILIAVQGFCLYNHTSSPPSAPAFHCCFCYKLLSSSCTNNMFCMHLLFTQLNALISRHPPITLVLSRPLFLRGLNAATFREHGSNSPGLVMLPDSTSNKISTRPSVFVFG